MKKTIIKTLSMVLAAASLFTVATGFKTIEATDSLIKTPVICLNCDSHPNNTVCGTHRNYIYGGWSDKYKLYSYSLGYASWATLYERKRIVTVVCTDCHKVISSEVQYQQRSYALGAMPMEDWHYV